jgi:hypothetical protein
MPSFYTTCSVTDYTFASGYYEKTLHNGTALGNYMSDDIYLNTSYSFYSYFYGMNQYTFNNGTKHNFNMKAGNLSYG